MIFNINYNKLLKHLQASAKKRKLDFNLTERDLIELSWPITCPLLKVKLNYNAKGYDPYAPSVDRLDSELGYVSGNIQIVSVKGNRSKNNLTDAELRQMAKFYLS